MILCLILQIIYGQARASEILQFSLKNPDLKLIKEYDRIFLYNANCEKLLYVTHHLPTDVQYCRDFSIVLAS